MQKIIITFFSFLLFAVCLFFVTDLVIGNVTHTDNRLSLDRSAKTALSKSVNWGTLRVEEEIEIEPSLAEQEFKKSYIENISFRDPEAKRNYDIKILNSKPAMIAVEGNIETYSYFNSFNKEPEKVKSNSRNIVIYEAKEETKKVGGNVE